MAFELPNEIWLIILREASTPGHHRNALNSTLADPIADYHDLYKHWYSHEGEQLRIIRSAITMVSRKWRVLSTPLLYERIILRSSTQFQNLKRTLQTSPSTPGRFVKALCTSESRNKTFSAGSSQFLDLLPNVEIFVHLQPGSFGDILNFHELYVLAKIKSFTFRTTGLSSALFCRALALIGPTLQILDISFNTLIAEGSSLIELPELHTLILGMNYGDGFQAFQLSFIARKWHTPKLKYIHGLDSVNGIDRLGLGKAECDSDVPSGVRMIALTRRDFHGDLAEAFPQLEDLILDCPQPIIFRTPMPSCVRIGIILPFHSDTEGMMARNKHYVGLLWDQFIPLMNPSTLPSLKLVRVFFKQPATKTSTSISNRNVSAFFGVHEFRVFWAHWMNRWKTRYVQLEAVQDGVVMDLEDVIEAGGKKRALELNALADEYQSIWEEGTMDEESNRSSQSSEGSEQFPTAMSLQDILQD